LIAAYTAAKLLTPNGAALSATNRASVILPRGKYKVSETFELDANFVDLVAEVPEQGGPRKTTDNDDPGSTDGSDLTAFRPSGTLIYSDDGNAPFTVVEQTVADVRLIGFSIAYIGTHSSLDFWGYHAFNITVLNTASIYQQMTFFHSLAYLDLLATGDRHPVGATQHLAGTWDRCASNGFSWRVGENGVFTANMTDCVGGALSFGGDAVGGSFGACSLTRCQCVGLIDSEASTGNGRGGFGGCQAYGIPSISTSVFTECESGPTSFSMGKSCAGTFIRCRGGAMSFGATRYAANAGTFAGYAEDCIGGPNSFGGQNEASSGKNSGTMIRCIGTGNTLTLRCEGATIRNSRITATTTGIHAITLIDSNVTISNSDLIVFQGGTGVPIYAATALNVAAYGCRMNNATNDADGLHANVTNLVTSAGNVVSNSIT
jgi:hypothetical protein